MENKTFISIWDNIIIAEIEDFVKKHPRFRHIDKDFKNISKKVFKKYEKLRDDFQDCCMSTSSPLKDRHKIGALFYLTLLDIDPQFITVYPRSLPGDRIAFFACNDLALAVSESIIRSMISGTSKVDQLIKKSGFIQPKLICEEDYISFRAALLPRMISCIDVVKEYGGNPKLRAATAVNMLAFIFYFLEIYTREYYITKNMV
ncbi:MAG: hypothetical protein FWC15_03715 [Fibromonadales bacterium]|nr:hypothetical protein [Fibromonadales bacterium]